MLGALCCVFLIAPGPRSDTVATSRMTASNPFCVMRSHPADSPRTDSSFNSSARERSSMWRLLPEPVVPSSMRRTFGRCSLTRSSLVERPFGAVMSIRGWDDGNRGRANARAQNKGRRTAPLGSSVSNAVGNGVSVLEELVPLCARPVSLANARAASMIGGETPVLHFRNSFERGRSPSGRQRFPCPRDEPQ